MSRPQADYETVLSYFWEKVEKGGVDDCWNWTAFRTSKPSGKLWYGTFKWRGISRVAHRVSWMINVGEIPTGLFVLHSCDNPACVNPKHLFLGTQKDNMRDCSNKGRIVAVPPCQVGNLHSQSKLTDQQVLQIRELASTTNQYVLADMFGVCQGHISEIVNRKKWTHL